MICANQSFLSVVYSQSLLTGSIKWNLALDCLKFVRYSTLGIRAYVVKTYTFSIQDTVRISITFNPLDVQVKYIKL